MSYTIIIPARLHSTRLPNKVLLDVAGKPLLQRTYEQTLNLPINAVYIATCDDEIYQCATAFGAKVIMTGAAPNGTARIAQAVKLLGLPADEVVVNLQADVPFIQTEYLNQVAANLVNHPAASIATLAKKIVDQQELYDRSIVKVVLDHKQQALYFTRAAVATLWHHIGIYAYRVNFLANYLNLSNCWLEDQESLEQLRALYYGYKITVSEVTKKIPHDVNTQHDLDAVIAQFTI